jgi:CHAT domain-containing protein
VVGWGRLEAAEAEVADLAGRLAPDVTLVAPVFADVQELLDGDPPADLLHFALHGTVSARGMSGGLVLLRQGATGPQPHLLQENHVRSHRLAGRPFVYLNACQLAAGDQQALGDYGGMAVAFLAAGAGAVLAPLWTVEDSTASTLALEFYSLVGGPAQVPAAEVLRRFRARYTAAAVAAGTPGVDAALVSFQLFAHPRLRLNISMSAPQDAGGGSCALDPRHVDGPGRAERAHG